ncbi:hypothetical protein MPSEU_000194400 [Mayamaea pseudoterrestris]|nr:hypothetical protein MPSEU_000194400 [Mayamaea pseudoterrestris]
MYHRMSVSPFSSSSSPVLSPEDVQVFGCDTWPLHYACRVGNLEHVQFLVDVRKYSVNQMDSHNASPLYLAALCGHNDICRFLLERGAKCDPIGDAARVFYVALTPELRNLLREWSLTAASRDPWLESMRMTFQTGVHSDCRATIAGAEIKLHRVILQMRCPKLLKYVRSVLDSDLNELHLPLEHAKDKVMLDILEYLYTGVFEARDIETALSAVDLANCYELEELQRKLQNIVAKYDCKNVFRCEVNFAMKLKDDMRRLAGLVSKPHAEVESLSALAQLVDFADTTLQCHGSTWSLHKFRLNGSEYFERALSGGFREAQASMLDLSYMVESSEILTFVIQWMYCDEFLEMPSVEAAIDIIDIGYMLICPRLSAYVANSVLISVVVADNAMDLISLAREHDMEKLEERCVEEIAANMEFFADDEVLFSLLHDEAKDIKQGGDERVIDVPLAAEIRRAIKNRFADMDDERDANLAALQLLMDKITGKLAVDMAMASYDRKR